MGKSARVYAVRAGRAVGIFDTWAAARAAVDGFPGAEHRSFADRGAADAWLRRAAPAGAAIVVYTDGSHVKGTARRGIGAYCAHGGREYRMRRDCAGLDAAASHPTLELLAAGGGGGGGSSSPPRTGARTAACPATRRPTG